MIFHFSGPLTLLINFSVWLVIHVIVSRSIAIIRPNSFNPRSWLCKKRSWENNGRIYQVFFKIKKWKGFLPDGAAVYKNGFQKKRLANPDSTYINRFIQETCRAEVTHWVIFLFSVTFFIWNKWWIGLIMIACIFVVNIPCIVTQRYNRIRLQRIAR